MAAGSERWTEPNYLAAGSERCTEPNCLAVPELDRAAKLFGWWVCEVDGPNYLAAGSER